MLVGSLNYTKPDGKLFKYHLKATDNSSTCSLIISSHNYDALKYEVGVDVDDSDYNILDERRLNIGLSSVTIQTYVGQVNGKKTKSPVNNDFFCRLSALIRYAKSHCIKVNELGYTGLQLASGDFEANPSSEYIIKFPMKDEIFANVTLTYGDITKLYLKTDDFEIDLYEDLSVETELFGKITDGLKLGFKIRSSEYLGFDVPKDSEKKFRTVNGMFTCIEDIVAAHPDKEFSWLLEKNYILVTDENLERICKYIREWDGYVYYDTETTGLKITFKSRIGQGDQLVGVVLSVKYGESFFFPCQMNNIPNLCNGDHFYFMEHYMRPILEGKKLVAHNMSFDWKVAYIYDINANIVHDTMALLKLTLGAEKVNYPIGLKYNAKVLLHRDSLELSDLLVNDDWGETDITFSDLPAELVRLYACADTDNTNGILQYALQNDLLGRYNAKKVYEIEIAFSYAVAYQEFYGHRINTENLAQVREAIGKGQAETMKQMVEIIGHEFNPNSPKQLISILYGELGIPEQISRKTGRPTTDKETLKKLAEITDIEDNIKYPFCGLLEKYREYEGVRKIIDKFPEYVTEDGYIFSEVQQYGTTTGRVSIKEPNYQSYNDPIKKNIIPRPGFWMFDTDYSSVEYRVLGNMVGNKKIMESFKDPDFDYHAYQAAHMYNVPYSAVTKKLRKAAKGINFGLPYGMGDESLGVRVFGDATPENTRKAAALRNAYFKGQEDIRDWFEYHRNRGVNEGFTETYFGRRRYYHRENFSIGAIRRQAGNQVIQGCMSGDTRIQTKEMGIIKLKDAVGYNYEIWDGKEWTLGDVLYSGKKRKCIVKFKGGQEIICSPQHKFLVVDNHGKEHWVEAQDLKFGYKSSANNSHVLVNNEYSPSNYIYSSKEHRNNIACSNNANNVFIDDISDKYNAGLYLGRLASDGSYAIRDDGGSYATCFVAEHEYNIIPELESCVESLNSTTVEGKLRKDRNEKMTRISVYSSSLVSEIESLDIKHTISDNIFMDTELLRGFLCGFFDGDGGVSGKSITLVFGTQYNFEPMCLDIQKALLFFGIRSRYRTYEDRYVIQIKTNDNQKFLDLVGFMNADKMISGRKLQCIEEEKTFGHCIVVDSVEVTDELIDMYDVCNTERGYYVADGIITHNTAADIYKTAVGRVFKRICREGWLGKVIFTGFIHDELLGEVSNEINPAVWLKALREEFEVKVTNPDGSPWSPLYMGFGYGMSWYEAKSVELPIKLQWEIVDKYGEEGFKEWNGNGREFCDTIPDKLRDFEVRDIRNQLLDADSQNKEIKPTLNNQIIDCVKEDTKLYEKCIEKYASNRGYNLEELEKDEQSLSSWLYSNEKEILSDLDNECHIQSLYKEDGLYRLRVKPKTDTQDLITQFCRFHATDRDSINILNIAEYVADNKVNDNVEYYIESDEDEDEDKLAKIIDTKIQVLGMYLDIEKKKIICLLPSPERGRNVFLTELSKFINKTGDGYALVFRDYWEKPGDRATTSYISSKNLSIVQNLYLAYLGGKIL